MSNLVYALFFLAMGCGFAYAAYWSLKTGRMTVGALDYMTFTREQRPAMFWWFLAIEIFAVLVALCGAVSAFLDG
jgi:hypothetical protein